MTIAVVDDDEKILELMEQYITKFIAEKSISCTIKYFINSTDFLENYAGAYDIIFLDIEIPDIDGFKVAKKIREIDKNACLIFVTNMAQYAILGYEVNALDFIVKPFEYYTFADKFEKALNYLKVRREKEILLESEDGNEKVLLSEIYYLVKEKNYIIYHTEKGIFSERGTMADAEKKFETYGFAKCNSGCLVNLRHVKKIGKDSVYVKDEELVVSRRIHKTFMDSLMKYLAGGRL